MYIMASGQVGVFTCDSIFPGEEKEGTGPGGEKEEYMVAKIQQGDSFGELQMVLCVVSCFRLLAFRKNMSTLMTS